MVEMVVGHIDNEEIIQVVCPTCGYMTDDEEQDDG